MNKTGTARETVRERLEASFYTLDIAAEIERHTGIRLTQPDSRSQYNGACPYPDCMADTNGFIVWPELTPRGNHYHCRQCKRTGDIIKLLQDIEGIGFSDTCNALGIPNPYRSSDEDYNDCAKTPVKKRKTEVAKWLLDELEQLKTAYPRTVQALQSERAKAYLAERRIPFEVAEGQGLGYIPTIEGFQNRWGDRIIFPVETLEGESGYCGRTLFLWQPGMDEEEHKKQLDAYNQEMKEKHGEDASRCLTPRYLYTYKEAYFHLSAIKQFDTLTFVEGPFDVLACIASDIVNAVAMGTTGIDAAMLPKRVCSVVMGLDSDVQGSVLATRLVKSLRRSGIDVTVCVPPDGAKDWSAAYRLFGAQGLSSLRETPPVTASVSEPIEDPSVEPGGCEICGICLDLGKVTPAQFEQDDFMYCLQHLPSMGTQDYLTTPEQVLELAMQLKDGTYVLDLETTGLNSRQNKIITIALGTTEKVWTIDVRSFHIANEAIQARWKEALHKLFDRDVTWAGHNLKFDWSFLAVQFGVRLRKVYDTMLVEKLIHNGEKDIKHNLLVVAARYDITVTKEQRSWFIDLDQRPLEWGMPLPAEQLTYIEQDIRVPHLLIDRQQEAIESLGIRRVVDLENNALPMVAAMEVHGITVDVARWQGILEVKKLRKEQLEADIKAVLSTALEDKAEGDTAGKLFSVRPEIAINLGARDQLIAALAALGVHIEDTKAESLMEVEGQHAVVAQLLEWKGLEKFLSSFGERFLEKVESDGRIHANFNQLGAASGRFSCNSPNLQQIPKPKDDDTDIRRCFIAPTGSKLLVADLSNIELRILAEASGDPMMLRFFAEGKDLHSETARLMFKLGEDVDTKKHLINGIKARDIAKTINFGLAYGMGATGLAGRVGVDLETAKQLMNKYFATYKGVARYLKQSGQKGTEQGYTESLSGRRRSFSHAQLTDNKQRGEAERAAKNHPIQGTNADILKHALALLLERLPEGVHVVLTVHDEILLEASTDNVAVAENILKSSMMDACREFLKVVTIPEPDVLIENYWVKG